MKIYTVTQDDLNSTPKQDHVWRWPGVTGPGEYTWNEAENTYQKFAPDIDDETYYKIIGPARISPIKSSADVIFGIGGIGIFEANETSTVPSTRAIARVQRMHDTDVVCRCCGASKNFDGAMFTTSGCDICDDCF